MDANAALEVFIGLVAMYLLLALICTIINEIVATVLALRAKSLKDGVARLLDDDNFKTLKEGVMGASVLARAFPSDGKRGASYLPSRQFASAILEYLGTGEVTVGDKKLSATSLEQRIEELAASGVPTPLVAFAREVNGDVDQLRQRVAEWYDDSMERWSGRYKRNIQLMSLIFATIIVAALNADTFAVAKRLWNDPDLRAQAVSLGERLASEDPASEEFKKYAAVRESLRPFPLGWTQEHWWQELTMLKVFGLVISALAVALGAPFWFEVLNKLNAIRGAGKKPEAATATS